MRGLQQRRVKGQVRILARLARQGMNTHVLQGIPHGRQLRGSASGGRQRRGGRLHQIPQFEQRIERVGVRLGVEDPFQYIGIEEIPARARIDAGANLRSGIDQALGGQDAQRFAIGSSRNRELFAGDDFPLKDVSGRVASGNNGDSELPGYGAVDA